MKDIMKKYKKHKIISNLWVLVISLFLALAINFFVIDWTEIWQNLKTSVLNNKVNKKSDIFLENSWDEIVVKNFKNMNFLDSISFSLVYNPENITIWNLRSWKNWLELTKIRNTPGFYTIILISKFPLDINSWEVLISFEIKKKNNKTESINLINANFSDSNSESYELTTSWITF